MYFFVIPKPASINVSILYYTVSLLCILSSAIMTLLLD